MSTWHATSRQTRRCSARSCARPRTATSAAPPRLPNRRWRRASSIRCCSMSLATRLEEEGKLEEALRLLERGVALAPADVPVRNALALVLQRLERPEEALDARRGDPRAAPAAGLCAREQGQRAHRDWARSALAQASHLRALELDPDNIAAMGSLASIATHRGEHAGARALGRAPARPRTGVPGCRAQRCRRRSGRWRDGTRGDRAARAARGSPRRDQGSCARARAAG